ncbi:MAG TPA: DUF3179 domain-containing (seleno)protein [Gemmatimonadaceae bacterium]|nr:DUF3179 domain-containing (seleno)protein [Gemmatimonadaceae bacterium]
MKKLFYLGILGLACFEVANVYFIMPMPGSQRMRSIDVAYALHSWRWAFRLAFGALILAGLGPAWRAAGRRRWLAPASLLLLAGVVYMANFQMSADRMFIAPTALDMQPAGRSAVDSARLVVGVDIDGDARAYPVQFIGYHHQVRDTVKGRPLLVTYCTVCRSGRVFDPTVDGRVETFRLVGMDHFNAMFEDRTTGSWWRQANGEAIVGPRTGAVLREVPSRQVTLAQWLALHPHSLVMQPDSALRDRYTKDFDYETGASRKTLTGTDTVSWNEKAWVVGLTVNGESRAYDWNRLRRERVVNDEVGGTPVVLVLAADDASFFAYERPDAATRFALRGDSLIAPGRAYALSGRGAAGALAPLTAYQEFWHSWRTFHPRTGTY